MKVTKMGKQAAIKKSLYKKPFALKFEVKDKKKLVAWGFLYFIFAYRHKEPYGVMDNVYVEKEYRSHGFGSKIIKEIIKEAKRRGCYKLIGYSRYSNTRAHSFYLKLGFKKTGYEFRMDLKKSKTLQRD